MPFHQPEAIRYYSFDILDDARVTHAVFTRKGGISPVPWAELNVGALVGDDPQNVRENRLRSLRALGRIPESVYEVWQVHSARVVCTDAPRPLDQPHLQADIILTDRPEVTLFMRFADCVPILLHDPVRRVVGLAHAGWLGTVRRAVQEAVLAMQAEYGSRPADILAAIGPSIGVDHYEIGPEVADQVRQVFGQDANDLLPGYNGAVHFDLWSANRLQLEAVGVREIEVSALCTACHLDDWYSHRKESGRTGRFGALISL